MMQMGETFYLAGSWARRDRCRGIAADIERETGMRCHARWLHSEGDDGNAEDRLRGAQECLFDVVNADRLVVVAGDSTSPGKHVEIGCALALEIPLHLVEAPWCTQKECEDLMSRCVFYHLADSVTDLDTFIRTHKRREAE